MSELIQNALRAAADRERPASIHKLEDDARTYVHVSLVTLSH
jgi:hypothetical protein